MIGFHSQIAEILSWRFVAEFWRRFPRKFVLIEAHPGGGQYDCLALIKKDQNPKLDVIVNRLGSVRVSNQRLGLNDEVSHSDWMEKMLFRSPLDFLDQVTEDARLVAPKKLPASTSATIAYRFIADFLAHSTGRLDNWECRNGFLDTSGCESSGTRRHLFEKFPSLQDREDLRKTVPFLGEYSYNYWFLIKNDDPLLCLDTNGIAHRRDGACRDLLALYMATRRIWPLIVEVACDFLP